MRRMERRRAALRSRDRTTHPISVGNDVKPRILATSINEDDSTASLGLAFAVAPYFDLKKDRARAIASEVGEAVAQWASVAAAAGLSKGEIARMASAFDHDDLRLARS